MTFAPPAEVRIAIRLTDPASLLTRLPHGAPLDILKAHHSSIVSLVSAYGGHVTHDPFSPAVVTGATKEELREAIADRLIAGFLSADAALRCAAEVHAACRRTLADAPDPRTSTRLQISAAMYCAPSDDLAERVVQSAGPGQLLCTRSAHEALTPTLRDAYEWQPASGGALRSGAMECLHDDPAVLMNAPFETMFAAEIAGWVEPRREGRNGGGIPWPERPHPDNGLVGLALSGGGMRSAVFSLGVAQALARHRFLEDADYLSTVSGGGYFGASLASLWSDDLPYPSLPHLGCGADFPYAYPRPDGSAANDPRAPDRAAPIVHGNESPAIRHVRLNSRLLGGSLGLFDSRTWSLAGGVLGSMVLLWILYLLPAITLIALGGIAAREWLAGWSGRMQVASCIAPTASFVIWFVLRTWIERRHAPEDSRLSTLSGALAIAVHALALWSVLLATSLAASPRDALTWWRVLFTFSPLILFVAATALSLGHASALVWRSPRAALGDGAALMAQSAALITGLVLLIGGVWTFNFMLDHDTRGQMLTRFGALGATIASSTITLATLKDLWSVKPLQSALSKVAFAIGGYVLLGLALVAWCWLLWSRANTDLARTTVAAGATSAILLAVFGVFHTGNLMINWLSLNRIYADLIGRTWIISARPPGGDVRPIATWNRVWHSDVTMRDLRRPVDEHGDGASPPCAPYPLICAAVNLPGSRGPKMPDRKSDSFVIAPIYSGSAMTRWQATQLAPDIDSMTLATAAAVSGAAIAPNMGEHTSRTLSIITTLFNVRMGRWVHNPRPPLAAPLFARALQLPLLLYWKEMLGLASRDDGRVYLSDGGHFENLGVYELFRRRCKYIVAVTADNGRPTDHFDFGNLGTAFRRARVDFGVEVTLASLKPLVHDPQSHYAASYFAAGRISYPSREDAHDVTPPLDPEPGVFILIKTGIVEDAVSADILNYAQNENAAFPYDATSDEQFDQPQFEAYRQLGFLAGHAVCDPARAADSPKERFEAVLAEYGRICDDGGD